MAPPARRSTIDTLTGEYLVDRTDILHDVGRSLNPAIDIGQVEGGFVQGMGWLTTEELWWDDKGRLRTHAPSTYKIRSPRDRPKIFNVKLAEWSENTEATDRPLEGRRRAAASCWRSRCWKRCRWRWPASRITEICPRLDAPATPERVLMAVERLKMVWAGGPGVRGPPRPGRLPSGEAAWRRRPVARRVERRRPSRSPHGVSGRTRGASTLEPRSPTNEPPSRPSSSPTPPPS